MAAKDIEAGRAHVLINLRDKVSAGLISVSKTFNAWGKSFAIAGGAITGASGAILAPMLAAAKSFATAGDEIQKMSARTGIGAEALSELNFAAQQSGTDLATVERATARIQRVITDASSGMVSQQKVLQGLGLNYQALAGLSPEKQFMAVATAIRQIPDPTARAGRAMQIFGRSGSQLLPLVTSDIAALRTEASKLALTMSTEDANAAAELGDAMNRVTQSITAAWLKVGAALAPTLTKISNLVSGVTGAIANWVNENRPLMVSIAGVAVAVGALGAAITTTGVAMIATGALIGSLASVVGAVASAVTMLSTAYASVMATGTLLAGLAPLTGAVGAAIAALMTPIGAAIAAAVALGAVLFGAFAYAAYASGLLGESVSWLMGVFGDLASTVGTTFKGVLTALASGQFILAAKILWAGLKLAFFQGAEAAVNAFGYLWKNAFTLAGRFFEQLGKLAYKIGVQLPKLIFSGLTGASLTNVIGKIVGELSANDFSIGKALDSRVARSREELNQLMNQAAAVKSQNNKAGSGTSQAAGPRALNANQRNVGQFRVRPPTPQKNIAPLPRNLPPRTPQQFQVNRQLEVSAVRARAELQKAMATAGRPPQGIATPDLNQFRAQANVFQNQAQAFNEVDTPKNVLDPSQLVKPMQATAQATQGLWRLALNNGGRAIFT